MKSDCQNKLVKDLYLKLDKPFPYYKFVSVITEAVYYIIEKLIDDKMYKIPGFGIFILSENSSKVRAETLVKEMVGEYFYRDKVMVLADFAFKKLKYALKTRMERIEEANKIDRLGSSEKKLAGPVDRKRGTT